MDNIIELTIEDIKRVFPKRDDQMHKGSAGRVLLITGSAGMAGCSVLSARAALRTGSGLVYVCTPKTNQQIMNMAVPEAVCVDWTYATKHLSKQLKKDAGRDGDYSYDAVAIGPGTGTGVSARRMLKTVLLSYDGPLVIDADGLTILAQDREIEELVRTYSGQVIITPHPGEAARLLPGMEPSAEGENSPEVRRSEIAEALAEKYGAISVLKGHRTLIAIPRGDTVLGSGAMGSESFVNCTGNPGMATAGSGDVLTGVIASLCGQGSIAQDAARAGVLVHGLAGDLAAEEKGEYGMIAGDIVEMLPYAIKSAAAGRCCDSAKEDK